MASNYTSAPEGNLGRISVDNPWARCQLCLFGGHVVSFCPKNDNRERLWMSPKAVMDGSTALRGGIPICWPWFGRHPNNPTERSHGYARTAFWQLTDSEDRDSFTRLRLSLHAQDISGSVPGLSAQLLIDIGEHLKLTLVTTNSQSRAVPMTAALHSYVKVDDITDTQLIGLRGTYLDKTANLAASLTPSPYLINAETDAIHLDPAAKVKIACGPAATLAFFEGHDSIVVWNPWRDKSATMVDMPDDGYRQMICVESAIAASPLHLEPGQQHSLIQRIG